MIKGERCVYDFRVRRARGAFETGRGDFRAFVESFSGSDADERARIRRTARARIRRLVRRPRAAHHARGAQPPAAALLPRHSWRARSTSSASARSWSPLTRRALHGHGAGAADRGEHGALRRRELRRARRGAVDPARAGARADGHPGRRQGRLRHHGRARLDEGDRADRRAPGASASTTSRSSSSRASSPRSSSSPARHRHGRRASACSGACSSLVFDRNLDAYLYWNTISYWVVIKDFLTGIGKSVVFGGLVTLIGCYNGLEPRAAARRASAAPPRTPWCRWPWR